MRVAPRQAIKTRREIIQEQWPLESVLSFCREVLPALECSVTPLTAYPLLPMGFSLVHRTVKLQIPNTAFAHKSLLSVHVAQAKCGQENIYNLYYYSSCRFNVFVVPTQAVTVIASYKLSMYCIQ